MIRLKWKCATIALILLFIKAQLFHALGIAPVDYKKGQEIDVEAIKMISTHAQIFHEYYSLPFCLPKNGTISYKSENLGEILRGDKIVKTPYKIAMAQNISCKLLCHKPTEPMTWNESYSSVVIERIQQAYIVYLSIDDFLAPTIAEFSRKTYAGYYIGGIDEENMVYINNYLKLKLTYHKHGENEFRVVGFVIEASSVDYNQVSYDSGICIIPPQASPQYVDPKGTKILFFYSVEWKESNVSWANRWNIYLKKAITDTHWNILFIITATVIVLSLSVAILLSMALEKDIARYRGVDRDSLAILESAVEESGLNLIYADLFRPPTNNLLFAAVVGGGIQVFVITFIIVLLAMFGMFSSASRGAIGNCTIYSFGFSGLVAGYFSGRLYKTMEGKKWKKSAFLTATLYPGIVFGAYFFLNIFLWNKHSSGAVPFSTMISLLGIWFGISLPLVYLGYFFGYHKKPFTHPVRTNHETRKIPDELRVQSAMFSAILAIIPFSIILMDYEQIMTTLWKNDPYNIIVFPFTFFIYLIITCCITSIIRVYSQLEKRDYRWWWESFTLGGISAVYIQIYAIYYFSKKSNITGLFPTLIYFSYMGLIVITYWFFVGTISFFAAYIFIKKIYATIKLD